MQSHYWAGLPYVVLAVLGVVGMVVASLLPETLGEDLPQTLEDAEAFLIDQPFLSFRGKKLRTKKNTKREKENIDCSSTTPVLQSDEFDVKNRHT